MTLMEGKAPLKHLAHELQNQLHILLDMFADATQQAVQIPAVRNRQDAISWATEASTNIRSFADKLDKALFV